MRKEKEIIQDLTVGSVPKKMLAFATPLFLSGLLQTVYNMVDMIVVGNVVGSHGLAAVSIGGDLLNLLTFIAIGFSNAGQIIISQYVGANQREKIGRLIGTLFVVLMGCAILMTGFFLFFHPVLMKWINTPPEAWSMAQSYIVTCICGLVFIYGYNLVSAIMRGMGDSKRPFLFIAIASIVNLILDLVFVAGMKMGPFGAALGTVIGQGLSFLFALTVLYRNRKQFYFEFTLNSFKIDAEVFKPLLALGIPMIIQSAAINFSKLFVNSWINTYGVNATAVSGIGNKLETIIGVVSQAISSAGGAMIAQNIGAGKFERVPKIMQTGFLVIFIPALFMTGMTIFFPDVLFGLFASDREVLILARTYIPIAVILYFGCVARSPMFALINGSGNSRLNLAVALLDGIFTRIGLAVFLGLVIGMGVHGFWLGNALSGYVPFLIGGVYYLGGAWKKRKGIIE